MPKTNHIRHRMAAVLATGLTGLALAGTASAVDLRDWGRKLPESERFVVLSQFNNAAVLDKETQLVWEKTAYSATSWISAHISCGAVSTGGRRGWRLPTRPELASLMVPGATSMPTVFGIPTGTYWTATEHPGNIYSYNAKYVLTVSAPSGLLGAKQPTENQPFFCVRGAT
jgi:hypothetical protein